MVQPPKSWMHESDELRPARTQPAEFSNGRVVAGWRGGIEAVPRQERDACAASEQVKILVLFVVNHDEGASQGNDPVQVLPRSFQFYLHVPPAERDRLARVMP